MAEQSKKGAPTRFSLFFVGRRRCTFCSTAGCILFSLPLFALCFVRFPMRGLTSLTAIKHAQTTGTFLVCRCGAQCATRHQQWYCRVSTQLPLRMLNCQFAFQLFKFLIRGGDPTACFCQFFRKMAVTPNKQHLHCTCTCAVDVRHPLPQSRAKS